MHNILVEMTSILYFNLSQRHSGCFCNYPINFYVETCQIDFRKSTNLGCVLQFMVCYKLKIAKDFRENYENFPCSENLVDWLLSPGHPILQHTYLDYNF